MIFKQNDLLGGAFSVQDFLYTKNQRKENYSAYRYGAKGINDYLQALKKDGVDAVKAFEESMRRVDDRIVKQASAMKGDTQALSDYAAKLTSAADGLKATGTSADFAAIKTKALGVATKAANAVLGTLLTTLGSMAVSFVISKAAEGIDYLINYGDKLAEAAEQAQSAIDEVSDKVKSTRTTVMGTGDTGGLAEEFSTLAQGVNSVGQNISLSEDQYSRYLEISNQLADLFPELTRHYDENGNAIVHLTGNIQSITQALADLVEAQQAAANQTILENAPDIFNNAKHQYAISKAEYNRQYRSTKGTGVMLSPEIAQKQVGNQSDALFDALFSESARQKRNETDIGYKLAITFDEELSEYDLEALNKGIDDILKKYGIERGSNGFDGEFTKAQAQAFIDNYAEIYQDLVNTGIIANLDAEFIQGLNQLQADMQAQMQSLLPSIAAALQENEAYSELSETGQAMIQSLLQGMDLTAYDDFDSIVAAIESGYIAKYAELINTGRLGDTFEMLLGSKDDLNVDARKYTDVLVGFTKEILDEYGVASLQALEEQEPVIFQMLDSLYETQADTVRRFDARMAQLHGEQDYSSIITSAADMELFLSVSDAYESKEAAYRAFLAARDNLTLDTRLEEDRASIESYQAHQEAIAGILAQDELTVENYEALISYSESYRDALELEGQQIVLNREALRDIIKAQNEKIKGDIEESKNKAYTTYHRNREQLEALRKEYNRLAVTGADTSDILAQITDLEANQNSVRDAINQYQILSGMLSEVSQAYQQYASASGASSPEDHYETNIAAVEAINSGLNTGKVGTSEFMAAVDLMIPVDVYEDKVDQVAAVGKYYDEVLSKYFIPTGDDKDDYTSGINNFLDDSEEKGLMTKSVDENGFETWTVAAGKTLKDFAEQLNLTEAAAESMFRLMDSYTFGGKAFEWTDELWSSSVDAQMYNYESQLDKYQAELAELMMDPDIEWDNSRILELQSLIDDILAKKAALSEETVVEVDAKVGKVIELQTTIDDAKSKLSENMALLQRSIPEELRVEILAENEQLKQTIAESGKEVAELEGSFTPMEIEVYLSDLADQKAELQSQIADVEAEIKVNPSPENYATLENLQAQVASIEDKEAYINVQTNASEASPEIQDFNEWLEKAKTNYADLSTAMSSMLMDTTQIANIGTVASDSAGKVDGLTTSINGLPETKESHIYTYFHQVGSPPSVNGSGGLNGTTDGFGGFHIGRAQGTAHVYGTAHAKGTDLFPRNWKLKRPELALTGELGPEMVVRGNEWFLAGENGTEFNQLQKGDIVFNHLQTEQLLNKGAIRGRGKARLKGTLPEEGLALVTGSFSFRKYQTSNWSGGSSGSSSSSTEASYNYNGSGNSSSSSDEDDFKETIDWVEKELDRLQRKIDQTAITAESAYKTFSERNKALASEYDQITNKMEENRKGIARYEAEADSVGLSESYAKLVRDGTIDIETITDEDLKDKIDQYTEWYFLMPLYLVTGGGYSVELLESPKGSQATAQR